MQHFTREGFIQMLRWHFENAFGLLTGLNVPFLLISYYFVTYQCEQRVLDNATMDVSHYSMMVEILVPCLCRIIKGNCYLAYIETFYLPF